MSKLKRKFASVILSIAVLFGTLSAGTLSVYAFTGTWADYAAASFAGGDGSQGNPYQINNAAQLAHLAKLVNNDSDTTGQAGKYFKLTADIDISAYEWEPIGYVSRWYGKTYAFKGNFDGNGHKVTGMFFGGGYNSPEQKYSYGGLFGNAVDATIKNTGVILSSSNLGISVDATHDANLGALVGYADSTNITNCYSDGDIIEVGHTNSNYTQSESANVGGLIGKAYTCNIDGCYSSARVGINYSANAGGLVGHLYKGTIKNSYSKSFQPGALDDIEVRYGAGTGPNPFVGGFVGYNERGKIMNCYADRSMYNVAQSGRPDPNFPIFIGGFVGKNAGSIKNCYASGKNISVVNKSAAVGNFVGLNFDNSSIIINSYCIGGAYLKPEQINDISYTDIIRLYDAEMEGSATSISYYTSFTDNTFTDSTTYTKSTASSLIDALNRGRSVTGDSSLYAWKPDTLSQNGGYPVFATSPSSSITLKNKTVTYNGASVTYSTSDIASQVGSYGAVSYTYYSDAGCTTAIAAPKNAGTYYVKATVTADSLYGSATSAAATLTINKATLTVMPSGEQKYLSMADPALTYTYIGNVSGETPLFTGTLIRDIGETTGNYAIKQGTLSMTNNGSFLASNYTLSFDTTKTLEIVASATLDTPNGANGWFSGNVAIKLTAPSGNQISSNGTTGWATFINVDNTNGSGKTATYYLKRTSDGAISGPITSGSYKVDNSAPTGTITMGTKTWSSFSNSVSLSLFFNSTKTATITANSQPSGTTVQYLLSDTPIDSSAITTQTGWQNGSSLSITPNSKKFIYAKLISGAGQISYINTEGIVIYTDTVQNTASITHQKDLANDETATVTLNGNTIAKINDDTKDLVLNTDYTISGGTISFKAAYLNGLTAGSHTLTISYNPMGLSYVATAGNQAPATTTIALTVTEAVTTYTISIGTLTGGTISANPTSAAAGATINLTVTPDSGKQLKSGTLKYNDGTGHDITGTSFTMPAANVTVSAEFEDSPVNTYTISIGTLTGGTITANSATTAAGAAINLTVTPDSGKQLKSGTLKYNDGTDHAITGTNFTMPAANVTVSAEFEDSPVNTYTISIGTLTGGTITANPATTAAGATVNLTITPDSGKQLKAGTLKYNDGTGHDITGTSFTMPAANVTVSAEFEDVPANTFTISIGTLTGGTITANPATTAAGATVNLTITPDSGKQLKAGTLKYNDGTGHDITGTNFTMPAANVTVSAEFEDAPSTSCTVTFNKNGGDTEASPSTKTAVSGDNIGTLPTVPTRSGYTFSGWNTAANGTGIVFTETTTVNSNLTVYAQWTIIPSGGGSGSFSGGGSSSGSTITIPTPPPAPIITVVTNTETSSPSVTSATTTEAKSDSNGKATAAVTESQITEAVDKAAEAASNEGKDMAKKVEIKVNAPADSKAVETSIPKAAVQAAVSKKTDAMTVTTPVADISFDDKSLNTISGQAAGDIKITAAKVDVSTLSEETKQTIGDRPVFNFSVTSGDKNISQFGGSVTVAVPYIPKPGEDPNSIVVYYINAQGKTEMVSNCKYDPATGKVSFTTSHFSQYAVGYNKVDFKDVSSTAWYSNAVSFVAARGITTGTGNGNYSPEAQLTRGQFLVMVMRAYGIIADENPQDNFADGGNTYYTGYLAAAKRLGITSGIGNNMFAPEKKITRQEMFTLLYNILKQQGKLPAMVTENALASYSDSNKIASWAKDAMTFLVGTGTISGNGGNLNPTGTTNRAQMAQVLYNLLSR